MRIRRAGKLVTSGRDRTLAVVFGLIASSAAPSPTATPTPAATPAPTGCSVTGVNFRFEQVSFTCPSDSNRILYTNDMLVDVTNTGASGVRLSPSQVTIVATPASSPQLQCLSGSFTVTPANDDIAPGGPTTVRLPARFLCTNAGNVSGLFCEFSATLSMPTSCGTTITLVSSNTHRQVQQ